MEWGRIAPGVWKRQVGEAAGVTPLGLLDLQPRQEALQALGERSLPFDPDAVGAEIAGSRVVVRLPLAADEKLFGLGLQFVKLDQRGRTRYLRVNSDPEQDTGETHAPVPFLVSSRGYGVLV